MKALIMEDAEEIVESIRLCLLIRWPHCAIRATGTVAQGLELVREESPDVVLLDIGLHDGSGLDALNAIRSFSAVPVIIVSAMADLSSRARGLEMGADDYIAKPFGHTELLARVHAVLRRAGRQGVAPEERPITGGRLSIDLTAGRVHVDGSERQLSDIEWKLLTFLARNQGRIIPLESVARNVWGSEFVEQAAIRMCVHRLRQKLGDDTRAPRILVSHRGRGYSFEVPR